MPKIATQKRSTAYPANGTFEYFDTETTGLDPKKDRVISLGLVSVVNSKITAKQEWFFNPGDVEINPEALKVHGITKEFLRDKPPMNIHMLGEILGYVMDKVVAGHNVKFDLDFMDAECKRFKLPTFSEVMTTSVCSMAMSKEKWPGKKAGLDFLLDRVKINRSHRVHHGALLDAELGAKAMICMGQEQMSMLDAINEVQPIDKDRDANGAALADVLVLLASDQEVAEHERYLAALDKEIKGMSIWSTINTPGAALNSPVVAHDVYQMADPDPVDLADYADIEESAVPGM